MPVQLRLAEFIEERSDRMATRPIFYPRRAIWIEGLISDVSAWIAVRRLHPLFLILLLATQMLLLVLTSLRVSPIVDEPAHLVAGLNFWENHCFDVYRVNPPLTRALAALPAYLTGASFDWKYLQKDRNAVSTRPEFAMGTRAFAAAPQHMELSVHLGRLLCIPFLLLGSLTCWAWSTEMNGRASGYATLALWTFSPSIIGWGSTISPDALSMSLGVAATYAFWKWLCRETWGLAYSCGLLLGLTQVTKMTWLIAYLIWPVVYIVARQFSGFKSERDRFRGFVQLFFIVGISVIVINVAYGFNGTGDRLVDYVFISRLLSGSSGDETNNRWRNTLIEQIPIPLPRDYIIGIDQQRRDFEDGIPSYLFGTWSDHGWSCYYCVCFAIKEPLCTPFLLVVLLYQVVGGKGFDWSTFNRANKLGLILNTIQAAAIFLFLSSQNGFSAHMRYALPVLPYVYILAGQALTKWTMRSYALQPVVACLFVALICSTVARFPNYLSYFNVIGNGQCLGKPIILGTNVDCGQDTYRLREWLVAHQEIRILRPFLRSTYSLTVLNSHALIQGRIRNTDFEDEAQRMFEKGWYAISQNELYRRPLLMAAFRNRVPFTVIGDTINIYFLSEDEEVQATEMSTR